MARRQSDCLTKYLLNTYATPFQCVAEVVAREGAVLEAVVAELEAGAEIVDFGGFGRECGAECGDCVGDPVVIGSFSASGSTGAPGVPPVAEVQQRAAGFVQPQAVGLMVPSYLDMLGHMQRIGTPYFEGGVSPEAAVVASEIGAEFPVYQIWFSTRLSWQSTI
ncbi:unnamed protein product [Microthlaspi erraticum]|uniref:Uncharacterized protein n=1 Tax=Microthlaspi erraticum TaxID=1685480 RepID=A0A6D2HJF5_9BRAS|nr:unnamed protein product [Microthlaspi erraticum]